MATRPERHEESGNAVFVDALLIAGFLTLCYIVGSTILSALEWVGLELSGQGL